MIAINTRGGLCREIDDAIKSTAKSAVAKDSTAKKLERIVHNTIVLFNVVWTSAMLLTPVDKTIILLGLDSALLCAEVATYGFIATNIALFILCGCSSYIVYQENARIDNESQRLQKIGAEENFEDKMQAFKDSFLWKSIDHTESTRLEAEIRAFKHQEATR